MENWHVDPFATTTAEALICSLAGVCNGASTWNGSGFSKLDASFGHSLADKAANSRPWTTKQALAALKLVRKYRKQLGGDDFINKWLETPVFKMTPADQAFTKATDHPNSQTPENFIAKIRMQSLPLYMMQILYRLSKPR